MMKICPPSNPGTGSIFKNAKFILINAMKLKSGIQPAFAVSPAICPIIIGPPRSFIVACPLANILNVNEIRPKLRKVFTYPADADSLRFVGTYE